jgi:deoxyribodipyrimidine photo-lyase
MKETVSIFWFRRDLRFEDNTGLFHALHAGWPVVPLFVFDQAILSALENKVDRRLTFIHKALQQLQAVAEGFGSTLDVRYGKPESVFKELIQEYKIDAVYTNHDYEPYATKRDLAIQQLLEVNGIAFHSYKDQVIFEKGEVVKPDKTPYFIFTPYAKKWKAQLTPQCYAPYESEALLRQLYKQPAKELPTLQELGFVNTPEVDCKPAIDTTIIKRYHLTRDIPSKPGTTRLGIHLRFGTISIRKLVAIAIKLNETFISELIWREFFMQQLWHMPHLVSLACKPAYDNIQWRNNEQEFERWSKGQTGFPIVDAGIREMNATGFMHNRVRMIVGSFLVKDLLIDWRWGEAYFASQLLDYELASNIGNWQWVAGCGCDAAPYFRIFNPTAQAKKFDPFETYIQKWVPEYQSENYPKPMVDHKEAAARCLQVYKAAVARPSSGK